MWPVKVKRERANCPPPQMSQIPRNQIPTQWQPSIIHRKRTPRLPPSGDVPSAGREYLSQMGTPESCSSERMPTRRSKPPLLLRQAVDHLDVHDASYTSTKTTSNRM